jgi:hypothetical protein
MKLKTTLRTYTQKDGTVWEWNETSELVKQLEKIHQQQSESSTGPNNSLV